jgi:hypothetical protein
MGRSLFIVFQRRSTHRLARTLAVGAELNATSRIRSRITRTETPGSPPRSTQWSPHARHARVGRGARNRHAASEPAETTIWSADNLPTSPGRTSTWYSGLRLDSD